MRGGQAAAGERHKPVAARFTQYENKALVAQVVEFKRRAMMDRGFTVEGKEDGNS